MARYSQLSHARARFFTIHAQHRSTVCLAPPTPRLYTYVKRYHHESASSFFSQKVLILRSLSQSLWNSAYPQTSKWFCKYVLYELWHSGCLFSSCAAILEQTMGARNRVGIGLSYLPTRLHRLAESIHGNRFFGSLKVLKYLLCLILLSCVYCSDGGREGEGGQVNWPGLGQFFGETRMERSTTYSAFYCKHIPL